MLFLLPMKIPNRQHIKQHILCMRQQPPGHLCVPFNFCLWFFATLSLSLETKNHLLYGRRSRVPGRSVTHIECDLSTLFNLNNNPVVRREKN